MVSILKALYDGEHEFCSNAFPSDPDYKKALREASALKEELKSNLSEKVYTDLEKLLNTQIQATSYELYSYFKDGFCTGMLLAFEVSGIWRE